MHLAFPLRLRGGAFQAVEQDSDRHRQDQAEVVLRTAPGTFEHDPSFGLRSLLGTLGPTSPVLLETVTQYVAGDVEVTEAGLGTRVRDVAVQIGEET